MGSCLHLIWDSDRKFKGCGCAVATRGKTAMLCLRIFVLFTLCTILNAIVCCLQLNTERGADANLKVDYLGTDACWIAVCVLCRNAQMNLIVDTTAHTCMLYALINCQLPSCNLFTQHVSYLIGETPLVNCGPRSILLHLKYNLLQSLFSTVLCKQTSFSIRYV